MEIITLSDPFPHYIIHDFFTESELSDAWKEIDLFHKTNSFTDHIKTGDLASTKKIGIVVDEYYGPNRSASAILNAYSKIFNLEPIKNDHLYKFLTNSNFDATFLSYYLNGGDYLAHEDYSVMSSVLTLWKEPKKFNGGDLWFPQYYYTPPMRSNSLIIFPSYQLHEVQQVESDDAIVGSSRYSISKFIALNVPTKTA